MRCPAHPAWESRETHCVIGDPDAASLHCQGPSRKDNKCCENAARLSPHALMTVTHAHVLLQSPPGTSGFPQQRVLTCFTSSTLLSSPSSAWAIGPAPASSTGKLGQGICPSPVTSIAQYSPVPLSPAQSCMVLHGPAQPSAAQCSPEWTSRDESSPAPHELAHRSCAQRGLGSPRSPWSPSWSPAPAAGTGGRAAPPAGVQAGPGPAREQPSVGQRGRGQPSGHLDPAQQGLGGERPGATAMSTAPCLSFPIAEPAEEQGWEWTLRWWLYPGSPKIWGDPGTPQPFSCWYRVQWSLKSFGSPMCLGQCSRRVLGPGAAVSQPRGCHRVPVMATAPPGLSRAALSIPIPQDWGRMSQAFPRSLGQSSRCAPVSAVAQSPGRLGALGMSSGCPQPGNSSSELPPALHAFRGAQVKSSLSL